MIQGRVGLQEVAGFGKPLPLGSRPGVHLGFSGRPGCGFATRLHRFTGTVFGLPLEPGGRCVEGNCPGFRVWLTQRFGLDPLLTGFTFLILG